MGPKSSDLCTKTTSLKILQWVAVAVQGFYTHTHTHTHTHCILYIGLSPDLHDLDQIRSISRPVDVPESGLLCDLLWSDPEKDMDGWGDNDRGVSFTFGADVVTKFLNKHGLDLVCRAHQVSVS